jgi:nitroimidazol reductase NimA-like FMN-containing flavoprotein (pyridoxamine 5'-phosphate oxidase superfamily)
MLGELTEKQCLQVLQNEVVGRIGCYGEGKVYVVPVTYAFDGKFIYAHSKEGRKIQLMRKNPHVCFQVDRIENMAQWRSVVAWGEYEELEIEDYEMGMKILKDRLTPLLISESVRPTHGMGPEVVVKQTKAIVFRISVQEITGRFEKNSNH